MILISLGSNLGDKLENISRAKKYISKYSKILTESNLFETEPWNKDTPQGFFLNQIIRLKTFFTPTQLLDNLLIIERQMGRQRKIKWEPRTIDLDILFFNNLIINNDKLSLPHPLLHERNFILDIIIDMGFSDLVHPLLNTQISTLKQNCKDNSLVKKVNIKTYK